MELLFSNLYEESKELASSRPLKSDDSVVKKWVGPETERVFREPSCLLWTVPRDTIHTINMSPLQ